MVIQRGEIWWTDGPDPLGSEPGFRRPMVVVQSDSFNRSAIRTVVAVAMTSNVRLADAPGNVLIPKRSSGLPRDSVVNVSQVSTVDRTRLTEKVRTLPASVLTSIDRGLRLVLDL